MSERTIIYNAAIYPDGRHKIDDGMLIAENGRVKALKKDSAGVDQLTGRKINARRLALLPGYIDVHVHGGFGDEFMKPSDAVLQRYSEQIVSTGTTAFYTSLVCASVSQLTSIMKTYASIQAPTGAHWLGIHMEGPFLSKQYKAVMQARNIRQPSLEEFRQLQQAAAGRLQYMTIAPELEGAIDVIDCGMRSGVGMMLGHSAASCRQAEAGLHAGALGFTHFYNAMSQHEHRIPGMVTAGLASKTALCELISDGYHVDCDVIRATLNCLGSGRLALITDGTLMQGLPDGTYPFSGYDVIKKDGTARLANGRLAGSVAGMNQICSRMKEITGCSLNDIVQMACVNPAALARIGQKKGKLLRGFDADMILLNQKMEVEKTFIMGQQVYTR